MAVVPFTGSSSQTISQAVTPLWTLILNAEILPAAIGTNSRLTVKSPWCEPKYDIGSSNIVLAKPGENILSVAPSKSLDMFVGAVLGGCGGSIGNMSDTATIRYEPPSAGGAG